jgi:hypothetical protein
LLARGHFMQADFDRDGLCANGSAPPLRVLSPPVFFPSSTPLRKQLPSVVKHNQLMFNRSPFKSYNEIFVTKYQKQASNMV